MKELRVKKKNNQFPRKYLSLSFHLKSKIPFVEYKAVKFDFQKHPHHEWTSLTFCF